MGDRYTQRQMVESQKRNKGGNKHCGFCCKVAVEVYIHVDSGHVTGLGRGCNKKPGCFLFVTRAKKHASFTCKGRPPSVLYELHWVEDLHWRCSSNGCTVNNVVRRQRVGPHTTSRWSVMQHRLSSNVKMDYSINVDTFGV